ncbi:MAG: hypothetical protein WBG08_02875 [Litorimonas sp.]
MSQSSTPVHAHDLLLVGGGAAALGALCTLIRTGRAEDTSVLMLDDNPSDCGRSGAYAHSYDVPVGTLLACLDGLPDAIRDDEELAQRVRELGASDCRAARPHVEAFLARLKRLVLNRLRRSQTLILRAARCDTLRHEDGLWRVDNQPGSASRHALLACGASEKKTEILADLLECGLAPEELDRVVASADALGREREAVLNRRASARHTVILGRNRAAADAVQRQLGDWTGAQALSDPDIRIMGEPGLKAVLQRADLIITTLGVSPNLPRILVDGQAAKFGGPARVDSQARLTDRTGLTLPSLTVSGPGLGCTAEPDVTQDLTRWFGEDGARAVGMGAYALADAA